MRSESIANMTPEERIKLRLRVESQQDGGNPSQFLELLAYTVENRIWEHLATEQGEQMTLRRLIELPFPDGIGSSASNILTLITLQHKHEAGSDDVRQRMERMRQAVRRELLEALPKHGEIGGGHIRDNIVMSEQQGNSQSYTIRRLRRDKPELAEKVIAGEMSANEAAIQAGFRTKPIYVPPDVGKAARVLARHFDVTELIDALARTQADA